MTIRCIYVGVLALMLSALSTMALAELQWKKLGVYGDTFQVYYVMRGDNDRVRVGLGNESDRTIWVNSFFAEYKCANGSTERKEHYISHRYAPGDKAAFTGFEKVCYGAGGVTYMNFKGCSGDAYPCTD